MRCGTRSADCGESSSESSARSRRDRPCCCCCCAIKTAEVSGCRILSRAPTARASSPSPSAASICGGNAARCNDDAPSQPAARGYGRYLCGYNNVCAHDSNRAAVRRAHGHSSSSTTRGTGAGRPMCAVCLRDCRPRRRQQRARVVQRRVCVVRHHAGVRHKHGRRRARQATTVTRRYTQSACVCVSGARCPGRRIRSARRVKECGTGRCGDAC